MPSLPTSIAKRILLLCLFGTVATLATAQPGTFEAGDYFEGLIQYKNTVSGPSAEFLQAVEHNPDMDIIFKNGHYIIHMFGGQTETTRLYNADSNWTYIVDPKNETVYYLEKHRQRVKEQPTLTPTGDSVQVMGLWCQGFQFTKPATENFPTSTTTLYVHPSYRVNLAFYPDKNISQAYWTLKGLDGAIPLKIIYEDKFMRVENTAFKVVPMKLSEAQFALPKEYRRQKWDYRR